MSAAASRNRCGAPVAIGTLQVGGGHPTYIIADIGINHNGNVDAARDLVRAAAQAGCTAVKFQKRTPELCVPERQRAQVRHTPWGSMTYIDYRKRLELSLDDFRLLTAECRSLGIPWLVSCWDVQALYEMLALKPPAIKVPSAGLPNTMLLAAVASTGLPIILSTGMSTLDEVDKAVRLLPIERLVLLHCTSTYPCPVEDLNLRVIETYSQRYPCPIGHSAHDVYPITSLAAVTLGASVIERHITLDRNAWGTDHCASLEPTEFAQLVRDIRIVETGLGRAMKEILPSERTSLERLRYPSETG
jgi:sialic acid synthase SpsE